MALARDVPELLHPALTDTSYDSAQED